MLGRGVAFEIDGYESDAGDAWSVVIKGYAIEIKKLQDYFDALDLPLFPWHAGPKHRFVRIEPVQITGRRFPCRRPRRLGRRPTDDASSRTGVTPT